MTSTATTKPRTINTTERSTGFLTRVAKSFQASVGTIVFGMEDGTVSIFGLVFGVAASARDSQAVLLAGATGAAAAAVSMMAGTFLDVESANDAAKTKLAQLRDKLSNDPSGADSALRQRLVAGGFTSPEANSIVAMVNNHPDAKASTLASLELGSGDQPSGQPVVQSLWMLITDLFAAAVPVVPFALLGLTAARLTSLAVTFVLLVGLGIGRALVGHRNIAGTVVETVAIAAVAAGAGIGIGKLVA